MLQDIHAGCSVDGVAGPAHRLDDRVANRTRSRTRGPAEILEGGDKTGTGDNGAINDLVITYPPDRRPIFIAVYMSESKLTLPELSAAHAEIGRIVAREKWKVSAAAESGLSVVRARNARGGISHLSVALPGWMPPVELAARRAAFLELDLQRGASARERSRQENAEVGLVPDEHDGGSLARAQQLECLVRRFSRRRVRCIRPACAISRRWPEWPPCRARAQTGW